MMIIDKIANRLANFPYIKRNTVEERAIAREIRKLIEVFSGGLANHTYVEHSRVSIDHDQVTSVIRKLDVIAFEFGRIADALIALNEGKHGKNAKR